MNFSTLKIGRVFDIDGVTYIAKQCKEGVFCGDEKSVCVAKGRKGVVKCLSLPMCTNKRVEMFFVECDKDGNETR
nr:hypothetical protein [uncultured Macellibacteroides sp.]